MHAALFLIEEPRRSTIGHTTYDDLRELRTDGGSRPGDDTMGTDSLAPPLLSANDVTLLMRRPLGTSTKSIDNARAGLV